MYYVNPDVANLYRIFDQNARDNYIRMDLNENPGGLPDEFIRKVLAGITPETVSKYPEQLAFTQKLAEHLGCGVENICLTNGSAEAIRYIIQAFTSPGGRIVSVSPSYAMYEVYSKMYGRKHVPVMYNEDLSFDVNNIIKEITPDTELVIVVNPNNPVGDAYTYDEMALIIEAAKKNEVTVLVDEAYHYFYPNSFIEFALKNEHVFVTRTCSKLFSLAGCRLGYAVGKPDGIALVQKLCTPHNVIAFGMAFAEAILDTPGMLQSLIDLQLQGKKYLVDKLRELGYEVNAKEGNFIFVKPKTDAYILVARMKEEKRILIKSYKGIGCLGNCLRISTGPQAVMEKFVNALTELDK